MAGFEDLCSEIINCKACDLFYSRNRSVCGRGNLHATIMIIGEAPGAKEDIEGVPFIGRSGKMLDKTLSSYGLYREDIYITNSVKCRPPIGKTPKSEHISACGPFLYREINMINPGIIVPMGNSALSALSVTLGFKTGKVTEMNGRVIACKGRLIIPQFHPAAILRNPKRMEVFRENFQTVARLSIELTAHGYEDVLARYRVSSVDA